jgi:hypothetical protein
MNSVKRNVKLLGRDAFSIYGDLYFTPKSWAILLNCARTTERFNFIRTGLAIGIPAARWVRCLVKIRRKYANFAFSGGMTLIQQKNTSDLVLRPQLGGLQTDLEEREGLAGVEFAESKGIKVRAICRSDSNVANSTFLKSHKIRCHPSSLLGSSLASPFNSRYSSSR